MYSNYLPANFNHNIYKLINKLPMTNENELNIHYLNVGIKNNLKYNIEVFVICGGKCGSSTLEKTFANNGYATIRAHGYEEFKLRNVCSLSLYELIEHNIKYNLPTIIIDSYRTPIERKISSFFHHINSYCPNYTNIKIEEIINIFNEKYLKFLENYHPLNVLFTHLNIEQFITFDNEKKYNIKELNNVKFIKIRFKDIQEWNIILSNITGKNIIVNSDNMTKYKKYYNIYNEFKKKYKVDEKYYNDFVLNDNEYKIYS
jgi:hypothetical protein